MTWNPALDVINMIRVVTLNVPINLEHSQDAFPICGKVAQQEVQVELSTALADFQMQLSVHVKLWSQVFVKWLQKNK